ncbi:hypothetical protein KFE94_03805 [bacterium SCSIO 12643]|nr:hypothetical protein KFE94_03805 [bacterium SCSIO 12643]
MRNIIGSTTIIIFSILTSCTTPNIVVSENLKTNTSVMDAKGRQGLQFNQVITFGDYNTSKVKRGWTLGYDISFVTRFKGAKEKLNFIQFTPEKRAYVLAVGKFKSTELELLNGFLSYAFQYENYFAGSIIPSDTPSDVWEFIIHNPEGGTLGDFECGIAKDKNGNEILIKGVREIEKQANWVKLDNFGFEFIYKDQAIGAVSTLNNGRVWIKNDISEELKLVLSCMSSSLLVRHSMQESVSDEVY